MLYWLYWLYWLFFSLGTSEVGFQERLEELAVIRQAQMEQFFDGHATWTHKRANQTRAAFMRSQTRRQSSRKQVAETKPEIKIHLPG